MEKIEIQVTPIGEDCWVAEIKGTPGLFRGKTAESALAVLIQANQDRLNITISEYRPRKGR